MTDALADPAARSRRARRLTAPHMTRLTGYAEALARRTQRAVPYFDPLDGGCNARVMILLQSPARFDGRPRFVSRDNPVPAQRNLKRFLEAAELARQSTVLWNVVPWLAAPSDGSSPGLRSAELARGIAELPSLLALFDQLRVVVLAGRIAQRGASVVRAALPGCAILNMSHPSPLAVCASPAVALGIVGTLEEAKRLSRERCVGA
ncbi:uracil-DNA glycosylase [Robbsia sp. Bb-Pol-6]|uniref:Uracil-DNA glycosylase n=2 Tax=Robbsia betulipollinis TaxID=2981849 RepID=A0ABT3ZR27_9BURK|nr:uracil-DNA glycosylase [Robbsia betulipollinis]